MVKIKLIARENASTNQVNISLEPCIGKGTAKENAAGAALLIKISQLLSSWEDETKDPSNYIELPDSWKD